MKIGIIGPETTAVVIERLVEEELPDVQLVLRCSEFFEESAKIAERFQAERDIDALLFTGPTNYAYARRRLSPTIPWTYLPHNRLSIMQALFKATTIHHSDLRAISVDRYEPEMMQEVLRGVGIHDSVVHQAPYDLETYDLERKHLDFHRQLYRSGQVSVCITSMEHICRPLLDEGIPCVRIYPANEIILEQIYHLQVLHMSAAKNQGRLATIAISFDYVFDDERDLYIREWEKMRYQNELKERIYAIAQRLEAAVFEGGSGHFFLVTTRDMVENVFLKGHENAKLLQFGHRSYKYRVWLGIGVGSTMLESRSRAAMALNRAIADRPGTSYLVESEDSHSGPVESWSGDSPEHRLERFTQQTHLSVSTLRRLARAVPPQMQSITALQLSQRLGITLRSTNRILSRLEEAGCITTVGKHTEGKGRPARELRIALPEELYQEQID